jgi:hypothetical protein
MNEKEKNQQEIEKLINDLIELIEINSQKIDYDLNSEKTIHLNLDYLKEYIDIDEHFVPEQDDDEDFIFYDESNQNDYLFYDLNYTKCDSCQTKTSLFWRKVARNKIVCNNCFFNKTYLIVFDDNYSSKKFKLNDDLDDFYGDDYSNNKSKSKKISKSNGDMRTITTRTLIKSSSVNLSKIKIESQNDDESSMSDATSKSNESNGLLRKSMRTSKKKINDNINDSNSDMTISTNRRTKKFKLETQAPLKCETLVSKITTSDYVFHRGFYMQIGDIVALFDKDDKDTIYFAKIRAFLIDQCGQKSAVLTWLVPIDQNYKSVKLATNFDPNLFMLGPSEEFPRPLDCMGKIKIKFDLYFIKLFLMLI